MSTAPVMSEVAPVPSIKNAATTPPPVPDAGETFKDSETTRLLCASAYLDRQFRDTVIKFCLEKPHQALGVSFGVDMATVVRHCRRGKKLLNSREIWLLLPSLIGFFAVISMISMNDGEFSASSAAGTSILGALFSFVAAYAICLYFESRARSIVLDNFTRGRFNPDAGLTGDDTEVSSLQAAENGNTLIYSGFTPFVGSGESMGAWSFALDLRKRACGPDDDDPPDLTPEEIDRISLAALYDCVEKEIVALRLDRVTVQDRLYVNGGDIRDDQRFLRHPLDKPRYRVDDSVMRKAMLEQDEKHLRHYRCVRVVDWKGELVLSIFLRFSRLSHNLFVEATYYLLTPVGERFRAVDRLAPKMRFKNVLAMLVLVLFKTPFLVLFAPFILLNRVMEAVKRRSEESEQEELIQDNPSFDYGAAFSFRQWASASEYRRYFQKLDKEMYQKVLEKNILDSILKFLEAHDVDVSEMKQRQSTILNNGVMVTAGGTVNADNLAAGKGATVKQKVAQMTGNPTPPPKAA